MSIQGGEKVAIIGEEGNGKSTLLKTLMGEKLADFSIKGEIQSDIQSLAYIPQKLPEELNFQSFATRETPDFLVASKTVAIKMQFLSQAIENAVI